MSPDELRKRLPQASDSFIRANTSPVRASVDEGVRADDRADQNRSARESAELERPIVYAATETVRTEKTPSTRFLVRVTDYRIRLIDEDNLSEKFTVDSLRYCGLLPSDAPGKCKIEVSQKKVHRKDEARVEIEIFPPGIWSE
jgi:hypothetical protein